MAENGAVWEIVAGLVLILTVLLGAFIFYLLVRLLILCVRAGRSIARLSSQHVVISLFSFSVAAYAYPASLHFVFNVLDGALHGLFVELPDAVSMGVVRPLADCSRETGGGCLELLAPYFGRAWSDFARGFVNALDLRAFPVRDTVALIIVWIILSLAFDRLIPAVTGSSTTLAAEGAAPGSAPSSPARNTIVFVLLLFFSSYLAFASIASIVPLSGPVDSEFDEQSLREQLVGFQLVDRAFEKRFPPELELPSPTFAVGADERTGKIIAEIPRTIYQSGILALQAEWAALRDFFLVRQERYLDIAVFQFTMHNKNRIRSRVSDRHFLELGKWISRARLSIERRMEKCRASILRFHRQFPAEAMATQLFYTSTDRGGSNAGTEALIRDLSGRVDRYAEDCVLPLDIPPVPTRGDLGEEFGAIAWPMMWLLRAESLPLSLIVGLLGFGLLGSTLSSIVRGSLAGKPLRGFYTENVLGIVGRGVGAAIVVFLAAYGGLAVFGATGTQPNAYVLLFTCLLAAVFSDEVWMWARESLADRLRTKGTKQDASSEDER